MRSGLSTVRHADRVGLAIAVGLQVVSALSGLVLVLASHAALTAIVDGSSQSLVLPLVLLVVATAVSGSVGGLQGLQQRVLSERVGQYVWRRLLRSCAAVDLLTFESTAFLHRLDRVRGNAVGKPSSVVSSTLSMGGNLIGITAMFGALALLAPLLIPVLLLGGLPIVLISRRTSRLEFAFSREVTALLQRRGYLKALLSHRVTAAELRAFDAAPEFLRRHDADDADYLSQLTRVVAARRKYLFVGLAASALSLAAALGVVLWQASTGAITLADAGAAAIAARLLGGQIGSLFRALGSLTEATPFLRDLDGFLRRYPPVETAGAARPLARELAANDLWFTYPGQSRPAVDGVSLSVRPGQVIALVGENGSGKTTVAKVLAGLYSPGEGRVTWDGHDLERADLRASCSILFQDFLRYQLSALDNVVVSDMHRPADRDSVEDIVARVGVGQALSRLPDGLDTVLGVELEEGGDLSGGQWQRLALARALYRDSSVIVLDEPSSALDPRAEHELFRDVRGVLNGRAAVLISHRYSSVRLADQIYVMHAGRVEEYGTHDQLMANGGRYSELYSLQAEGFAEAPSTDPALPS